MPETIALTINGKRVQVGAGASVAAAVFLGGETAFRASTSGEPRAALCGMGICFECRVSIDGRANCRSCQIAAREGMVVSTT